MVEVNERRKTPRVMVRVLVDYESSDTYFYDYSNNLSEGGIYIETDRIQSVGSKITLRFTLPGIDRVFEATGHVTWAYQPKSGDGGPPTDVLGKGMGIQFDTIEPADKKFIQEYLNKHIK
mgnify:CR=1 FL=1